jgi:hypothetical protein
MTGKKKITKAEARRREKFMRIASYTGSIVNLIMLSDDVHQVLFSVDGTIVRATRRRDHGKIRKNGNCEIVLTIGKPNLAERRHIALFKSSSTIPGECWRMKREEKS